MAESLPAKKEIAAFVPRTSAERKLLRGLKNLLAHKQSHLAWYHRVGSKLIALEDAMRERGPGWFVAVANALMISPSNLTKMRKFARDFKPARARMLDAEAIKDGDRRSPCREEEPFEAPQRGEGTARKVRKSLNTLIRK